MNLYIYTNISFVYCTTWSSLLSAVPQNRYNSTGREANILDAIDDVLTDSLYTRLDISGSPCLSPQTTKLEAHSHFSAFVHSSTRVDLMTSFLHVRDPNLRILLLLIPRPMMSPTSSDDETSHTAIALEGVSLYLFFVVSFLWTRMDAGPPRRVSQLSLGS